MSLTPPATRHAMARLDAELRAEAKPVTITITGRPVPWARARSNGKRRYTPAKQKTAMTAWGWAAKKEMKGAPPFEGPVEIAAAFFYEIPPGWDRPKRNAAIGGEIKPTGKPDIDNLGKLVMDALKDIAFKDDAQVVRAKAGKFYGPCACSVVTVTPL